MVGVPRVGWVGILPPSGIAGVVDFVFDAPLPRTWAWRYAAVAFPLDVLVSMMAYSRLIRFPIWSNSSRRMTPGRGGLSRIDPVGFRGPSPPVLDPPAVAFLDLVARRFLEKRKDHLEDLSFQSRLVSFNGKL